MTLLNEKSKNRLISSRQELMENLNKLENIRLDLNHSDVAEYLEFIRRGTCFVPYETETVLAFAPSRFLGYQSNDFRRHKLNSKKHGSDTNIVISQLLGHDPAPDDDLERHYKKFCSNLGILVPRAGAFGHPRRFWKPLVGWSQGDLTRAKPKKQHFKVGELYTRSEVADLIGLSRKMRGGDWLTGYTLKNSEFFIFTTVGASGRTGHNYANRWEGKELIWYGKSRTAIGQPEMTKLLSGDFPVHVFWRGKDRAPFTYAGLAAPVEARNVTPVEVRWAFDGDVSSESLKIPLPPRWRRGPPPGAGPRISERTDGPTSVYILSLEGPLQPIFPRLAKGGRVIKIGMSNNVGRRIEELSSGFPPGCLISWKCVALRGFPDSHSAFAFEAEMLERVREDGSWIGGEFAIVCEKRLTELSRFVE